MYLTAGIRGEVLRDVRNNHLGTTLTLAQLSQWCDATITPVHVHQALGAGGTLARHVARSSAEILGALPPRFLGFAYNRLDRVDLIDAIKAIENVVSDVVPDYIYTHHGCDLNIDHAICHRAVLTACWSLPGSSVRRIYAMEVASSTEWALPGTGNVFMPTRFVDISSTLALKRRALDAYAKEMCEFPHVCSFEAIEALARWRGVTAGVATAETFAVLRDIED